MRNRLDSFYLIVSNVLELEEWVPLGVKLVQLRIKELDPEDVREQIAKAQRVCQEHRCQLVINDYWEIAIELGCNYVHLGQEDLAEADVGAIRRAGIELGISSHSEEELALALEVNPSYVALGPVYETILKKMPWPPQGLERVATWKKRIGDKPLVGIGGISLARGASVLAAGADSVAVVTDVSLHNDPQQRVRDWLCATR